MDVSPAWAPEPSPSPAPPPLQAGPESATHHKQKAHDPLNLPQKKGRLLRVRRELGRSAGMGLMATSTLVSSSPPLPQTFRAHGTV